MTTTELVNLVSAKNDIDKKKAKAIVETIVQAIKDSTDKDEEVKIVNLGTFKRLHYQERKCYNPQTGETNIIPPTSVVRFLAYKDLKRVEVKAVKEKPKVKAK